MKVKVDCMDGWLVGRLYTVNSTELRTAKNEKKCLPGHLSKGEAVVCWLSNWSEFQKIIVKVLKLVSDNIPGGRCNRVLAGFDS